MKIVSSQTDKDIQRAAQKRRASIALVQLAANALRVIAGAGDPAGLVQQAALLAQSAGGCDDDAFSGADIAEMLDPELARLASRPWLDGKTRLSGLYDELEREVDLADAEIVRSALRLTAARLAGNHSHESQMAARFSDALAARNAANRERLKFLQKGGAR